MIADINSLGVGGCLVLIAVVSALVGVIVRARAGGRPRAGLMWDETMREQDRAGWARAMTATPASKPHDPREPTPDRPIVRENGTVPDPARQLVGAGDGR